MSSVGFSLAVIETVLSGGLRRTMSESKGVTYNARGRACPPPLPFSVPTTSLGEPVTPTSKMGRRSFWDKLVMTIENGEGNCFECKREGSKLTNRN